MNMNRIIIFLLFILGLIALWQLGVMVFGISEIILPSPSAVVQEMGSDISLFLEHGFRSLSLIVGGFFLATGLGFLIGASIAYSGFLKLTLYPLIVAIRSLPIVAIAPFIVIWIGYGAPALLSISFIIAFFPITIGTISGLTRIDPDMLQLMRSLRASEWQIFTKLRFKNSIPYLFDGFKIAITLAAIGVIVGEFIAADAGLGYLILVSNFAMNIPRAFASLVFLVFFVLSLYGIILLLDKQFSWKRE